MKRHYYLSDDLDDLDLLEQELESSGVHTPQIHVFSRNDGAVDQHDHLHNIESIFKKDIVHGTMVGACTGLGLAVLVLLVASYTDWPQTYTWIPFVFLALVLLGFSAWSGGLYGIQQPHRDFKRFESHLRAGNHVFIVDVDPEQEARLERIIEQHPRLQLAGTGKATPRWVVLGQYRVKKFTSETFP